MNIARKALAIAAVAGLGMTAFAASADAAPKPPAKKLAAGDWAVAPAGSKIEPSRITPIKGAQYTVSGTVAVFGNQATKNSFNISFNAAPGGGAVSCVGAGSNGAAASSGKITWTDVEALNPQSAVNVTYTITCTYQRDYSGVITEKYYLNSAGRTAVDETNLGDRTEAGTYTVGGTLPSGSASPKPSSSTKPTTKPTPTKDKDSNGGLSKTGV